MKQNKQAFIKLYKKIRDWEWYEDPLTFKIFIDCLLRANWKDTSWKGIALKRGEFISSLETLAKSNGLGVRSVRTAILHLETTGELTRNRHGKFMIFTVNNYDSYQSTDTESVTEKTNYRHDADTIPTQDEEYKRIKKNEKKKKDTPLRGKYFDDPNEPLNDSKLLEPYLDCDIFLNKEVERAVMIRRKELGLDE